MGKVIVAVSGKGGVGKTTFITNLGVTLAERGLKVALIDMNMGLRNLDLYMGLENKTIFDAADVLNGICKPKKAFVKDKRFSSLYVMPAAQRKEKFVAKADDIKEFYYTLKENFDYVLVDGPSGINEDIEIVTYGADIAVIVTTPEYVALRDADMIDRILEDNEVKSRVYLVNKVNRELLKTGLVPTFEEIATIMKIPLLGIIQYDENIILSANCGIPIVMQKGNYLESNYKKIMDRLMSL